MRPFWIFYVARRFLSAKRQSGRAAPSVLSIVGIATGVVALTVVLSVMNGFQIGFIEDILEINSFHVRLAPSRVLTDSELQTIRQLEEVRSVLPFFDVQALLGAAYGGNEPCQIRVISETAQHLDPELFAHLNIIDGEFDPERTNSILLGAELAGQIGVVAGMPVSVFSLAGKSFSSLFPEQIEFIVSGIFRSGYYDFDSGMAFVSQSAAGEILGPGQNQLYGIKLHDRYRDKYTSGKISGLLQLEKDEITIWRDYNRAFFNALRIEKLAMTILLSLIFVVTGFNIYHSLKRSVYEKREEIAVLRSIGAKPSAVVGIFLVDGVLIGATGGGIGLLVGLLVASRINEVFRIAESFINGVMNFGRSVTDGYVEIFSPAYFYLSEVPIRILFGEVLAIFLFAVISAAGASFFASRKVGEIQPVQVFRYE